MRYNSHTKGFTVSIYSRPHPNNSIWPKKSLIRRLDGNGTLPRGMLQNPSGNGKWRHHCDLESV